MKGFFVVINYKRQKNTTLCFPFRNLLKVTRSCASLFVARLLRSKRITTSTAGVNWLEAIASSHFNRVNQLGLTITPKIKYKNELPSKGGG